MIFLIGGLPGNQGNPVNLVNQGSKENCLTRPYFFIILLLQQTL
jgi:hypothetical protein